MKLIIIMFSVLFTMPVSLAANVEEQRPTVCLFLTEFEADVRSCMVEGRGLRVGERGCSSLVLSFALPDQVSDDVEETIYAFLANVLVSCGSQDSELSCVLTETVSAKAEHQCAASGSPTQEAN